MEATAAWKVPPRIVVDAEDKWAAFRTARAALAASGTVTLELAVSGIPTVVSYKISLLEEAVARLMVSTPTIVLANLVLGEHAIPEILQREATPERLAAALVEVIGPSDQRTRQLKNFPRFDAAMGIGRQSPATLAADVIHRVLTDRN
jgi:lipid-A-disaccharide synthase